jgi:ABC-type Fe3+ transport system substrate-binding protein
VHQHYALLASPEWQEITRTLTLISPGISDASSLTVRHAMISEFSPNPRSLRNGAPVTGTAVYLTADPAAWEKTWALWTGIVANVPGCTGVTGGWMVEPVDGYSPCFVV